MQKSDSIKELAAALSKAQGNFEHARKDEDNPFFKSKYATLASVIDAAKKHLCANGLSVAQVIDCQDDGLFLETILLHSSGEWLSGKYPIRPVKPDPQSVGSACTYARRQSFSAITGIAADDDDGNNASDNTTAPAHKPLPAIDYYALIDDSKTVAELASVWKKIPPDLKPAYAKVKDAQKQAIIDAINGSDDVPNFPSTQA